MPLPAFQKQSKIAVLGGAGGVGSTLAFSLLTSPLAFEVVLVDTRARMTTSHVMDLENAVALGSAPGTVYAGGARDAADADVVVFCAAAPLRPNTSRAVYLAENARIADGELRRLREAGFDGVVLMLTNPVDVLSTCAHRAGLLPRGRVIGYTLNDSLRLRTAVADALGPAVHPRDVDAAVLGEHGSGQVPILSRAAVRGQRVRLDEEQHRRVREYIDTWYVRHVALDSGRTSTWASGLGAARTVQALCTDADEEIPACVALDGEYGIYDVCVGVPAVLGRGGVRAVRQWELAEAELDALRRAAAHIGESADAALRELRAA